MRKKGEYMREEYPLMDHLDSWSRAALVSFLFGYALQHSQDLGAFRAWITAGQAFDPWSDTRRR
jgi:hypothetical protein